jgi:hypothetical protein
MSSVELVLLKCPQCSTPVPAEEDEVAWVCATCGAGLQLGAAGLAPLAVHWAALAPGAKPDAWRPFWVFSGSASFAARQSFGAQHAPDALWGQPVRFFVPAFVCPLAQLQSLGADLTRRQPALAAGPAGTLSGCTFSPEDAEQAAEFVVLSIEAAKSDKLREVSFTLQVGAPELWVLPFSGDRLLV